MKETKERTKNLVPYEIEPRMASTKRLMAYATARSNLTRKRNQKNRD